MAAKKANGKKKFPIWIIVVAVVMIAGIFITIRINSYLKEKKAKKMQTAVVEPDIDGDQTRKGYKSMENESLMDVFSKQREDSIANKKKEVKSTSTVKPKTKKKEEPVKVSNNALSASIVKVEAKPVLPKPKVKEEKENVKFNFTVVKEDEEKPAVTDEEEDQGSKKKGKSETTDLTSFSQGKIYGNHVLKHNEPVNLRTTEKVTLSKSQYLPVGALLYGISTFSGNRMKIRITRAMTDKGNFPVDISVYDSYDFQEGIFIEGKDIDVQPEDGITDVADEVSDVMPNQLIGTTMKTASKLVQKDVKQMKKASIKVEDSYVVYLKVNNTNRR